MVEVRELKEGEVLSTLMIIIIVFAVVAGLAAAALVIGLVIVPLVKGAKQRTATRIGLRHTNSADLYTHNKPPGLRMANNSYKPQYYTR